MSCSLVVLSQQAECYSTRSNPLAPKQNWMGARVYRRMTEAETAEVREESYQMATGSQAWG